MFPLLIAILSGLGFILAYHTYGRWLGRRIFNLASGNVTPANRLEDGHDYVPTRRSVVFGHHFTSIAGTGPIVGPAIGVLWGWLPALIWVVFGSIFIGAVHDFGSLLVSLRNDGQTIGDVAGRLLNRRVRLLFMIVLFIGLTIVLAIFGLVIASVFRMFPAAIFPCLVQIPLAVLIGVWLQRRGAALLLPSLLTLLLMIVSVVYGDVGILGIFNDALAALPMITWVLILLAYAYIASVLPVWMLLQPRDYINALQLIGSLGLIVVGLVVAGLAGGAPVGEEASRPPLEIIAPIFQWDPEGAPLIIPFLFITIACGAISGFHCLVSSGTTSKQLASEDDARFVGYGSMLTEGFLAVLVILACTAGLGLGIAGSDGSTLTGEAAWTERYGSWEMANGLGAKVGAFVDGAANFLGALGIPAGIAVALMGVFVASFAGTTLDTACRLQRYVVQELASTPGTMFRPIRIFRNPHAAAALSVVLAAGLAAVPASGDWSWASMGSGGLILWPLFGATNQLLAGLAFLVIASWLWRRRKPVWFLALPLLIMLVIPMWAMIDQIFIGTGRDSAWLGDERWLLAGIGVATILLEGWMCIEALLLMPRIRGVLEGTDVKSDIS
ncbi:MAG: carbon starvation protein A [Phycisphaerae bacterium]|mgnify:CR=1 FL=1|nr:carbon starvation protein A [Phycisphaerae bacterium]|tara:strand:- start:4020 stop:5855 length:1836 start_codon:yes stop_codon:yes gene_type:complete